jgi:tRNA threonylcarbamoyladenosine biosynthesis protein TsaE
MIELGRRLGENLFDGAVVGLAGPMGAGKTTLAGGVADGMGIDEDYIVSSPTYTIMQSYPCRKRILHHLDLYRIQNADDLDSTGYRDSMEGKAVLLVEWPEREASVLPRENLIVQIDYTERGRSVALIPSGGQYKELVEKVMKRFESSEFIRLR